MHIGNVRARYFAGLDISEWYANILIEEPDLGPLSPVESEEVQSLSGRSSSPGSPTDYWLKYWCHESESVEPGAVRRRLR